VFDLRDRVQKGGGGHSRLPLLNSDFAQLGRRHVRILGDAFASAAPGRIGGAIAFCWIRTVDVGEVLREVRSGGGQAADSLVFGAAEAELCSDR
jgi:hypothetical protein